MWRALCLLLLSCNAVRAADALDTGACHQALAALQAQEDAVRAAGRTAPPDAPPIHAPLEARRLLAARACLGGTGERPPAGQHRMHAPIAVPPVAALRQGRLFTPVPTAPTAPAAPAAPSAVPLGLTGCDAVGCWSADGVRLRRDGPYLVGPLGLCHAQGTQLICP